MRIVTPVFLILALLVSCHRGPSESVEQPVYADIRWDALLSDDELTYYLEEMRRYNEDQNYQGSDTTPPYPDVNPELDNLRVRIPGFAVGIDAVPGQFDQSKSFLFVPYQGACIHVPPPPPNQTIYVEMRTPVETDPYIPIWLIGTMIIEAGENELAEYFYRLEGDSISPYEG
jgi:hypothetical protein